MDYRKRLLELETLLAATQEFWRPQPFRVARPGWCERLPDLAAALLNASDDHLWALEADDVALRRRLAAWIPELGELEPRIALPSGHRPEDADDDRWAWEIPGRKRHQIEAFAAQLAPTGHPLLDWCGGKGHLGRLLGHRWQVDVTTLDRDPALCRDGARLAERLRLPHRFAVADALTVALPANRHVVALHACGDLHRRLLAEAPCCAALDIAPCCYHKGVDHRYRPLSSIGRLDLTRDDLRLAVTETVTASPRLARRRERDTAWKLAFDSWRRSQGDGAYRSFKPVPNAWFDGGFEAFFRRLAAREGFAVPASLDFVALERQGFVRQHEVARLSLLRHAFRRPLEVWLALDMAVSLEERGFMACLTTFCPRPVTPRNLLLSARR